MKRYDRKTMDVTLTVVVIERILKELEDRRAAIRWEADSFEIDSEERLSLQCEHANVYAVEEALRKQVKKARGY